MVIIMVEARQTKRNWQTFYTGAFSYLASPSVYISKK